MTVQTEQSVDRAERLRQSQADVCRVAEAAIVERMALGVQQGYDPGDWLTESQERHIRRAVKHAMTHLEIRDGDRADDGENNLAAAVCRMSMALSVAGPNGGDTDD